MGEAEGGETVIGMYYMREDLYFQEKEKKLKLPSLGET